MSQNDRCEITSPPSQCRLWLMKGRTKVDAVLGAVKELSDADRACLLQELCREYGLTRKAEPPVISIKCEMDERELANALREQAYRDWTTIEPDGTTEEYEENWPRITLTNGIGPYEEYTPATITITNLEPVALDVDREGYNSGIVEMLDGQKTLIIENMYVGLEPVALDVDGKLKPLDELSDTPVVTEAR